MTTLTKFPGTLAHFQDQMIDVFAYAVPAKKFEVYLFGSRARGDEEEGSDADLAISGTDIDRCDLSLIREQWEYSTIPMMLDLVDSKDINSALTEQIEREKILLWTSN
ncbi:nucleotidyltransferase domain-containing protein [Opitutales bacterium]|nr:nucleotidyltransferase domain-containing protein [Opitutales bacterium]